MMTGRIQAYLTGTLALRISGLSPELAQIVQRIRSDLTLQRRLHPVGWEPVDFWYQKDDWLYIPRGYSLTDAQWLLPYLDVKNGQSDGRPLPPWTRLEGITLGIKPFPVGQPQFVKQMEDGSRSTGIGGVALAPTRSGKTLCAIAAAINLGRSTLILVDSVELLRQWKLDLMEHVVTGDGYPIHVGVIRADRFETDAPFAVATIQTLARRRLDEDVRRTFGTIIVDECLPGDERVVTDLGLMRMDDPRLTQRLVLALSGVYGRMRWRRVLRHIPRPARDVLRVTTSSGRSIRCTSDERFLSEGRWRYLSELHVGSRVTMSITVPAPVGVGSRSSLSAGTTFRDSRTVGVRTATNAGTSRGRFAKQRSLPALVGAGKRRRENGIATSRVMDAVDPTDSTQNSSAVFTEPCLGTHQLYSPRRGVGHRGSRSHTGLVSVPGPSSRWESLRTSVGVAVSRRTMAMASCRFRDRLVAALSWYRSTILSVRPMGAGGQVLSGRTESGSLVSGSTELTCRGRRGGTQTTGRYGSVAKQTSSIRRGFPERSAKSSRDGSRTLAIPQRSMKTKPITSSGCIARRHFDGERSVESSSTSRCSTSSTCEEEIVSIEPAGFELVYDIEVEEDHNFVTEFGFVVHNCQSAPCKTIWGALARLDSKTILGLTATPRRSDGLTQAIYWLCGPHIATLERKMEADVKFLHWPYRKFKIPKINKQTGQPYMGYPRLTKWGRTDKNEAAKAMFADEDFVNWLAEWIRVGVRDGRRVLVMVHLRANVTALSNACRRLGLDPGEFMGSMSEHASRSVMHKNPCIATLKKAGKGVDFKPAPTMLVVAAPVADVEQITGRGLQPQAEHKPLLVDVVVGAKALIKQAYARLRYYRKRGFDVQNEPWVGEAA